MKIGQYRALVGYLMYWQKLHDGMNLDVAIIDLEIKENKEEIIHELFKAGYEFNNKNQLEYKEAD